MRFATVLILFMAMLNFIPPQFAETEYFNNSYYTILYGLLTVTAVGLPFMFPMLPKMLNNVSLMFAAWYFSSLSFEIMGWANPEILEDSDKVSLMFTRYCLVFSSTISLLMIHHSWKNNTIQK